ncbi:MAG TPA: glutathione S-transferase family protein [Devosiaceae bacterium]|nr:glutathione S-transferase family protein [Devosiaceae bacterium]
MNKLTLISSPTCPYVQRAVIALKEKHADFDVVYVDLQNKPDWFLAISPMGKVPLLRVERDGGPPAIIFESAVILEYLEETLPGEKLHPADALHRAQHRAWIEFCSNMLGELSRFSRATDPAGLQIARAALSVKFKRLESELAEGPYFSGTHFSLVDTAFAPFFRQIDALETVAPTALLDGFPRIEHWRRALANRPSVKAAVPEDYVERYLHRLRELGAEVLKAA